jgi:two-component system LytT family response regulator
MPAPPRRQLTHFCVQAERCFLLLRLDEIHWIEAARKHVRVHSTEGTFLQRDSLGRLETLLDPQRFLRISRGVIVNLDAVREIHPWFGGDYRLTLRDGTQVRSSRSFRERLRRLLYREVDG